MPNMCKLFCLYYSVNLNMTELMSNANELSVNDDENKDTNSPDPDEITGIKPSHATENIKIETSMLPEFTQRHPLQNRWVLWYLKGDRNKEWEQCLKSVALFDTVEDFWALYNHIQPASGIGWNSDYYLFKEGIKPMWEDPANLAGGRWLVQVDKQRRHAKLDQYWQEVMMAVIGEQFEELGDHICGAVVNVRQKGDKVALWTRDATLDDVNTRIGQILKTKLKIPDNEPLRYEVHKENAARTGSTVKPRIVLPLRDKDSLQEVDQQKRKQERERTLS